MSPRFAVGEAVRVRAIHPPGHARTPYFVRGRPGVVAALVGAFANPEEAAYGRPGLPKRPLYRIAFRQVDLWPDYAGGAKDSVVVDILEHWLQPEEANGP